MADAPPPEDGEQQNGDEQGTQNADNDDDLLFAEKDQDVNWALVEALPPNVLAQSLATNPESIVVLGNNVTADQLFDVIRRFRMPQEMPANPTLAFQLFGIAQLMMESVVSCEGSLARVFTWPPDMSSQVKTTKLRYCSVNSPSDTGFSVQEYEERLAGIEKEIMSRGHSLRGFS